MNKIDLNTIKLGIVTPMAGEEATARQFISAVLEHCHGFKSVRYYTVVDRASGKPTENILSEIAAQDSRVKVVVAYENRNVVDAYMRGYQQAIMEDCDWILEIDGGFSHRPEDIPRFFATMQEDYDAVFGCRFCKGGKFTDSTKFRYLVSFGGTRLINLALGTKLEDMTSGFELFKKKTLEFALEKGIHSKAHFFQTEIKYHLRNHRITELPIHYKTGKATVGVEALKDSFRNLYRLYRNK